MLQNTLLIAKAQVQIAAQQLRSSLASLKGRKSLACSDAESVGCVEPLERRQMLAGDVTAVMTSAGTLRITGSNEANQIIITDDGFGHIDVRGKAGSGTTVNGALVHGFLNTTNGEVARDLIINMRGGDDFVEIDDIAIVRNTRLNMGSGNDTVGMFDTGTRGNLRVSLGTGDDLVGFSRTTQENNVRINGGAGVDTVGIAHCFSVNGRTNINTGSGGDAILLQGEFDKPVVVSAGSGEDFVRTNRMTVHDRVRFQLGGGDDELVVGSIWASFEPFDLTVVGGAGFDTLVKHPTAPTFTERTIDAGLVNPGADLIVNDAVAAVSLLYVFRGGDPTDLPCI